MFEKSCRSRYKMFASHRSAIFIFHLVSLHCQGNNTQSVSRCATLKPDANGLNQDPAERAPAVETLSFSISLHKPFSWHNHRQVSMSWSVWDKTRQNSADSLASHLEPLVSLRPPVETLNVAAVHLQGLITVSDSVSVLLQWQVTQCPDNTHTT